MVMTVIPKSHEQRIAELERQVADLQRTVGRPSGLGILGIQNADGTITNLQMQAAMQAAQGACGGQTAKLNIGPDGRDAQGRYPDQTRTVP